MRTKQFTMKVMYAYLVACLTMIPGCTSTSAAGSSINTEAQKAAEQYAAMQFVKCGDVSYESSSRQKSGFRKQEQRFRLYFQSNHRVLRADALKVKC